MPKKPNQKNKTTSKKQKLFNQQTRVRADTRMSKKALNDLITQPGKTQFGIDHNRVSINRNYGRRVKVKFSEAKEKLKRDKSFLGALKTFFKTDVRAKYESGFLSDEADGIDRGKIKITKRKGNYYKNRKDYRSILLHEIVHSMHIPRENLTASAIETYFKKSKRSSAKSGEEIAKMASQLKVLLREKYEGEHNPNNRNVSRADLGRHLGNVATEIERKTKVKGTGIFYIREVAFGKDPIKIISAIAKGRYNTEISKWLKVNPRFAKLIH